MVTITDDKNIGRVYENECLAHLSLDLFNQIKVIWFSMKKICIMTSHNADFYWKLKYN